MDARTPGEVLSAACGTIPALERCLALTDAVDHVLSLCSFKTADARAISGKGKHRGSVPPPSDMEAKAGFPKTPIEGTV